MSGAGKGAAVASTGPPAARGGPAACWCCSALAVAVQLVVLYAPDGGGPPLFPQRDKVVHVLVFLVPVALAVLAGFRPAARRRRVFAAQAVLSEVVQAVFLPHRSGDVLDAVADLTGVALGVLVGTLRAARAAVPRGGPAARADRRVTASGRGLGDAVPLVDWVVHRGARAHGRVRRNRRVRRRPIPPGAPVTPRSNRPARTTVADHRVRGSSCFAAFAIGSKTCLSTSDSMTKHR